MRFNSNNAAKCLLPGSAILAFCIFCLPQCQVDDSAQQEQYVSIKLNDSLKNFDSVDVSILADGDTTKILGKAWTGHLTNPAAIPDYRIPNNETRNLSIQVKGFDAHGLLVMNMLISKVDGKQVVDHRPVTPPSLQLVSLTCSPGSLSPGFNPDHADYEINLAYAESSFTLTAVPAYTYADLIFNGKKVNAGTPTESVTIPEGGEILTLFVTTGRDSGKYSFHLIRGENPNRTTPDTSSPPDSVAPAKTDANLISLNVSKGAFAPLFSPAQKEYLVVLSYADSLLSVAAVPRYSSAVMTIESVTLLPSVLSAPISIPVGEGIISIKVTSGKFSTIYSIRTMRLSTSFNIPTDDTVFPNKSMDTTYKAFKHQALVYLDLMSLKFVNTPTVMAFPLLVRLSKENFNFAQTKIDGSDIRFSKLNGQSLSLEISRWDATAQVAEVWVKLDSLLTALDTLKFYMYWGNENANSRSNPEEVFKVGTNFSAVYHLSETGIGDSDDFKDATGKYPGRAGNGFGKCLPRRVEGVVGYGQDFYPDSLQGNIALPSTFDPGDGQWTFQAWLKKSGTEDGVIFRKGKSWSATDQRFEILVLNPKGNIQVGRAGYFSTTDNVILTTGAYTHLGIIYDGGQLDYFIDGQYIYSDKWTQGNQGLGDAILGSYDTNGRDKGFRGSMDEVWFSSSTHSRAWIRLSYESQKPNSTFVHIVSVP